MRNQLAYMLFTPDFSDTKTEAHFNSFGLETHTTIQEILLASPAAQITELTIKIVPSYYKQLFSLGIDHKHRKVVFVEKRMWQTKDNERVQGLAGEWPGPVTW
jgi:hypothetical protein